MRRLLAAIIVLALALAAGVAGTLTLYRSPGPLPHQTAIVVPHGPMLLAALALQRAGALPSGQIAEAGFRLAVRLTGGAGPIHAGEFDFPAHASLRDMLAVLRFAPAVQHALTIPEGLTAVRIAALLAGDAALTGPVPPLAEGSVLPQTYDYVRATTRGALLARMQRAMARRLASVWAGRDPAAGLAGPDELLVLASMVERETARPDERPMVARVFLNRLRLGMKLQSDPTVIYAVSGGLGTLPRPLSRADLLQASPYNTYVVPGLPPGPICAPGMASMQAVAHPASGNALYFVADGSGGHAFAEALPQHKRNVARLRAREAAPP